MVPRVEPQDDKENTSYSRGEKWWGSNGERKIHGSYNDFTKLLTNEIAASLSTMCSDFSFLLRALRSGITDICMGKVDVDWIADSKRMETEGNEKSLAAAVEIDAILEIAL